MSSKTQVCKTQLMNPDKITAKLTTMSRT
jgi:hypothetical protein